MPCDTRIQLFDVPDDVYTKEARQKLGLPLEGQVTAADRDRIKLEAAKLRTADAARKLNRSAFITGLNVGSNTLNIRINL